MDAVIIAVRAAVSLAVVLGVVWFLHRRLTRGTNARPSAKPVSLIGRQAVGQKASVVVIEVDGTRFLLGVTEQSVSVLHSGDAPAISSVETTDVAFARTMTGALAASDQAHGASPSTPSASAAPSRLPVAASTAFLQPTGAFAGSILSPSTWRQAATVLKSTR